MVTITTTCEKCGQPLTLVVFMDGRVQYRHDTECLSPSVDLKQPVKV